MYVISGNLSPNICTHEGLTHFVICSLEGFEHTNIQWLQEITTKCWQNEQDDFLFFGQLYQGYTNMRSSSIIDE